MRALSVAVSCVASLSLLPRCALRSRVALLQTKPLRGGVRLPHASRRRSAAARRRQGREAAPTDNRGHICPAVGKPSSRPPIHSPTPLRPTTAHHHHGLLHDRLRRRPAARARRARGPQGTLASEHSDVLGGRTTCTARVSRRADAPCRAPQTSAVVCAAAPKPVQAAKLALAGLSAAMMLSSAPPAFATNLCSSQPTCASRARAPRSCCTPLPRGRALRRQRGAGCTLCVVPRPRVSTTGWI
jgi:hypothetical protein